MSVPGIPPPPNVKAAEPDAYSVSKFLFRHEGLKQRPALLGGQRFDMFRCKRACRLLLSDEYKTAQQKMNSGLPKISDRAEALALIAKLPPNRFAINVTKLETEDALAQGLKPQSGVPVVMIPQQQKVGENEYMIWLYNPTPIKTYLYAIGFLLGIIAIAFFQLWPMWARQGAYYASTLAMVFVGTLIVLGIVRLVLFLLTAPVLEKGFWLFPNLFADVGFFQSFRPVWSWSGDNTLPVKPKPKKRKSKVAENRAKIEAAGGVPNAALPGAAQGIPNAVPSGAPGGQPMLVKQTPNGPVPVGPAQVIMTPNGPMVMTPNGPVPIGPNGKVSIPGAVPGAGPQGPQGPQGPGGPGVPMMMTPNGPQPVPPIIQQAMARSAARADVRIKEQLKKGKLTEPIEALKERLFKEEFAKEQQSLMQAMQAMQAKSK